MSRAEAGCTRSVILLMVLESMSVPALCPGFLLRSKCPTVSPWPPNMLYFLCYSLHYYVSLLWTTEGTRYIYICSSKIQILNINFLPHYLEVAMTPVCSRAAHTSFLKSELLFSSSEQPGKSMFSCSQIWLCNQIALFRHVFNCDETF